MSNVQVKTTSADVYKQTIKAGSHSFSADAPKSVGGSEAAPDPHELLLGSLGACTSITMQMYAKRKGWDLKEVTVDLSEEKVDDSEHPGQTIAKISRTIKVTGDLAPDQVESLRAIADKCPIHKLLSGPKQISTSIDLN
jgi:putative redox protein